MSTAIEGLIGQISIGGTLVALLTGIDLSGERRQTPWRAMGTWDATQILKGARNFEGAARKAYLCGDWLDVFLQNQTEYDGTIYPRGTIGCGTISGTIACKTWNLRGMETETETAVIEELSFDIYNVNVV